MRDEVCVVGAGGAGLAAGQALAARGVPFRIFEARDGIGGMWRHGETFAYDSLTSNTSRYRTSFRAHRMRMRGRPFIHHTEFLAYLESFADRFGVRERVALNARVERAEPAGDGWLVTIAGRDPEPFRGVVVASGVLGRIRRRELPGTFAGRRLHSAEYRRPQEFAGQDVVVAGMGSSGLEIAGELLDHARSVTLAVRTPMWVFPKHLLPRVPFDIVDTRLNARLYPWSFRRRAAQAMIMRQSRAARRAGIPRPDHPALHEVAAGSDSFVPAVRSGRLAVRPGIARLDDERIVFTDGRSLRADALIEASGYDADLGFLPPELSDMTFDHTVLLRGVAHPEADGLFFVGFVVGQGALLPMMEAQANWLAAVLAGELEWPGPEERARLLAEEARVSQRDFGRPHSVWRDRQRYIMELEREVARGRASRGRAG